MQFIFNMFRVLVILILWNIGKYLGLAMIETSILCLIYISWRLIEHMNIIIDELGGLMLDTAKIEKEIFKADTIDKIKKYLKINKIYSKYDI